MMGNRNAKQIFTAVLGKQHYVALFNMVKNYPASWQNISRYLTGAGQYPYDIEVKTPLGMISPRLYSHHDLLTVNEIFCRHDYFADEYIRTVVDLGSNIGISALYFLTRNKQSRCYLYEPDKRNIAKLRKNLAGFEERYELAAKAVSHESGQVDFGIESIGRYGGIGQKTGETIKVECLDINDVLEAILNKAATIDILKIDTEGVEIKTVQAIQAKFLNRIKKIYIEAKPADQLHPDLFWQKQYGSVCQLINCKLWRQHGS